MFQTRKARPRKSRKERHSGLADPSSTPVNSKGPTSHRWGVWLIAFACLVGGGGLTYYLLEYVLWPRIPSALVGQWRGQGGKQDGVTLEFWPNGAFQARVTVAGKEGVAYGRAQLEDADGKVLSIISLNPRTGREETKTHIIRTLTKTELVMEDPTGEVSRFVRLD